MSKYISKAEIQHIPELVNNMLPEDLREIIDGAGANPALSIFEGIQLSELSVVFWNPQGELSGIAGVSEEGAVWMHCTWAVKSMPVLFCKEARTWLDSLKKPLLWNCADIRNQLHLKLLKHLGFKFLNVVPQGPHNRYFVEFVKLWIP